MAALNATAKAVLRDAGITQAAWARANFMADGKWWGDACGCPDDRCMDGYHHYPDDECGCLAVLLEQLLAGEGVSAGMALPPVRRQDGRMYWPRKITAHVLAGEDEVICGVLVTGTHDEARALPLARDLVTRELGGGYGPVLSGCGWWRDGFGGGRRCWVTDEERGAAGVLFGRIEERSARA